MAEWARHPPVPARGDMVVTPDNQYLLCDSGVVFYSEERRLIVVVSCQL